MVPKDQIQLTQVQKDNLVNLKKKGLKACLCIYQSTKLPIFYKIVNASTTKDVWDILMNTYKGVKKVKKARL